MRAYVDARDDWSDLWLADALADIRIGLFGYGGRRLQKIGLHVVPPALEFAARLKLSIPWKKDDTSIAIFGGYDSKAVHAAEGFRRNNANIIWCDAPPPGRLSPSERTRFRHVVDRLALANPVDLAAWRNEGVDAHQVRHPLRVQTLARTIARDQLELAPRAFALAIMPPEDDIATTLSAWQTSFDALLDQLASVDGVFVLPPGIRGSLRERVEEQLRETRLRARTLDLFGHDRKLWSAFDCVWSTSRFACLAAAFAGVPSVYAYARRQSQSWLLARRDASASWGQLAPLIVHLEQLFPAELAETTEMVLERPAQSVPLILIDAPELQTLIHPLIGTSQLGEPSASAPHDG